MRTPPTFRQKLDHLMASMTAAAILRPKAPTIPLLMIPVLLASL